jgi:hypothetical protein
VKDFLLKHADLESEGADVLMAFVFATWFVDCFLVAPVLYLHGPGREVGNVMRLLDCLCYHAALLSGELLEHAASWATSNSPDPSSRA